MTFERIYIDGEPRERDEPREKHLSIEAQDIKPSFRMAEDIKIINKPFIDNLIKHREKIDASNTSKSPKKKAKKIHSRTKQSAVARIQKKL